MRFWDLSDPEVEAADALPWDGPLASMSRPFTTRSVVHLMLVSALLLGMSGTAGLVLARTASSAATHETSFIVFNVFALSLGLSIVGLLLAIPPLKLRSFAPALGTGLIIGAVFLVTWGLWSAGPRLGAVASAYASGPLFAFYLQRVRWAVVSASVLLGCFGLLLWLQDGWVAPLGTWLFVAANVIGTAVLMGHLGSSNDQLATSEHEARVELDQLNHTLEDRVAHQVTEIERLGGLRRFLSPQVADLVLAAESEELGKPHRRRIAVVFCDLRGFTAFTNQAEPEEVVGVLDDYYRAVGGLLQSHGATIGGYAGDGIMAYFGDPVPREDAALAAVTMAGELGSAMAPLVDGWGREGYRLSYGVGLAYGYATLGVVGFDGRYDYTPLGAVVNLAARLCGQAGAAQVLLDHASYAATSEQFTSAHFGDLDLKGYGPSTPAYLLADVP